MRFHPHRVDARVGPAARGHLLERLHHIHFFVIDRLRPAILTRHAQAFRKPVDGDHPARSEEVSAFDSELADRPAAPDRNGVPGLNRAVLRRHVAGWKNVREEENLIVA